MDNRTPPTPEEELSALVGWLEWAATRYAGIPSPSIVRWVEERLATLDRERDESLRRGEALNRALIERDDARDAREARERRERVDPDPETGRMALALRSLGLTDEQVRRVRTDEGDWLANTTSRERVDPDLPARIEALHKPVPIMRGLTKVCDDDGQVWPCHTARAILATEAPREPTSVLHEDGSEHERWEPCTLPTDHRHHCRFLEPWPATPDHTVVGEERADD